MGGHEASDYWEESGLVLLWSSMLLGPLAWELNLQIGYPLVKWACSRDQEFLLTLVAAVTFGITMVGAYLGWSCLAKVRETADERGGTIVDRSYFMATVAIGLNALLGLLILTSAFPQMVLSPCE